MRWPALAAAPLLAAALLQAGCSGGDGAAQVAAPERLLVLAAASTADALGELARDWTLTTGVEVTISAGPSSALAAQVLSGAPADVFLSASPAWAESVMQAGRGRERASLFGNALVLIVPRGDPAGVSSLSDLLRPEVARVAIADDAVPAGIYASQALGELFVPLDEARKLVRGRDVREVLTWVERGEVEAGFVYATDARSSQLAQVALAIPPAAHAPIAYVAVLLERPGASASAAERFYRHLGSAEAARVFARHGFVTPLTPSTPPTPPAP